MNYLPTKPLHRSSIFQNPPNSSRFRQNLTVLQLTEAYHPANHSLINTPINKNIWDIRSRARPTQKMLTLTDSNLNLYMKRLKNIIFSLSFRGPDARVPTGSPHSRFLSQSNGFILKLGIVLFVYFMTNSPTDALLHPSIVQNRPFHREFAQFLQLTADSKHKQKNHRPESGQWF